MRSNRNVVLGIALGALGVAGTLWAENSRPSLPLIKPSTSAAPSTVSQYIVNNIDQYTTPLPIEKAYHAKITNPSVSWQEKCQLAIDHRRLELLSSDIGGVLGGRIERANSILRVHLLCPQEIAVFDVPARFEVHTAPHPEVLQEMSFDTEMYAIEGSLTAADGIFSSFHIVGGTGNGFKSPGHTSLIPASDGFAIDSTFNVAYHVDFVGAQGGPLEGASGSVDSSVLMKAVGR